MRPIRLPGFSLEARAVVVTGRPTIEEWTAAMQLAVAAERASPYWIGDLMAYAEGREDYKKKLDHAIGLTGASYQTIVNLAYISRHVEEPERQIAPSISHAAEVAPLARPDQTKWLNKANREGWTRQELRQNIKQAKRQKVIDGQATMTGMFRVIYAAPDWDGVTIADLCKVPVRAHSAPDAVLFLWVPASILLENPGPREVIEGWDFTYRTNYVWDQVRGTLGKYSFVTHQHLIVATRGNPDPDAVIDAQKHDSVMTVRKLHDFSGTPSEARALIEHLYTEGRRLEIFGAEAVEGWTVWGDDAAQWPK